MAYKDKSKKTAYQNEFIKSAYDRINLTVPKGRKAELQAVAEQHGQSVNRFINDLIDGALKRERAGDDGSSAGMVSISPGSENTSCDIVRACLKNKYCTKWEQERK